MSTGPPPPGSGPPYGPPPGPPPGSGPPYGPPPGPPPGQPYRSPYGGYAAREHPQGTTVLVLGILGIVLCQLIGPVAWVMGNNALAEIDRNPTAYTNRGTVQAGRICGIVATALLVLSAVFVLVVVIVVASSSST